MNKTFLIAALFAGFLAGPVQAQTNVGDWTVEKRVKDTHCNASRVYKDEEDDNRHYGIVLNYSADRIAIVLVYEGWEWEEAGEILRAKFATDKDDIMKKSRWEVMDKTSVRGVFEPDQKILERLSRGKRLYVDFEEDDDDNSIEIETPHAAEMLAALKFCEENRK